MKTLVIQRKTADFTWDSIPEIELEYMKWTEWTDIRTWVRICYDDEAMYLRFAAKESEIRAVFTGPADPPCLDSCFEFFFSPILGDNRYMNFEFNPNTCVHIGYGAPEHDRVRLILHSVKDRLDPVVEYTDEGWTLTYKVPFEFINMFFFDFKPTPGLEFRGNFYKCGDKTPHRHYLAWNPVTSEGPNFHRPQDFGKLIFE